MVGLVCSHSCTPPPIQAPSTWGEEDGVGECRFQGAFCILKEVVYFLEGLSPALEGAVAAAWDSPLPRVSGCGGDGWLSAGRYWGPALARRLPEARAPCVRVCANCLGCSCLRVGGRPGAAPTLALSVDAVQEPTDQLHGGAAGPGAGRAACSCAAAPSLPEAEVAREPRQHARPAGGAGPAIPALCHHARVFDIRNYLQIP